MKYTVLTALLVLIITITACARPDIQNTQDTTQDDKTQDAVIINDPAPPVPDNKIDPNVAKLFEKSGSVKSYKFDLFDYAQAKSIGVFFVKGDKAKLELVLPANIEANAPDYVYFNLKEKTAKAYCLNTKRCDPVMGWDVEYNKYMVTLPPEWIESMKYGANTKSLTFYSRLSQVIQYEVDGKWYEGYVDNYFGFPIRVAVATDKEMTNLVGGYEYRSIAFNSLSDSDVIAPVV